MEVKRCPAERKFHGARVFQASERGCQRNENTGRSGPLVTLEMARPKAVGAGMQRLRGFFRERDEMLYAVVALSGLTLVTIDFVSLR